ncbi:MAG: hypothetical protein ACKPCM_18875 [Pseudanabaena sp.]
MKSLFRAPKNKLSNQLLIGFGISLAIIGLTTLSVTYAYLRSNLEEQVKQRAMSVTQGLEFASEGLIEDKETFLLDRIVQNYSTLPTVLEISIVNPEGKVLAHSRAINTININESGNTYADIHPNLAASLQQASRNGTEVNLRTVLNGKPIFVQFLPFSSTLFKQLSKTGSEINQYRGVAITILDLQEMGREALQNALLAILAMTISTGLILAFMGWLIRKLVLAPLEKIHLAI